MLSLIYNFTLQLYLQIIVCHIHLIIFLCNAQVNFYGLVRKASKLFTIMLIIFVKYMRKKDTEQFLLVPVKFRIDLKGWQNR